MDAHDTQPRSFLRSPLGIATILGLVVGLVLFLWTDRTAAVSWLPWLVVLACPLLHVFMHRVHNRDESDHRSGRT